VVEALGYVFELVPNKNFNFETAVVDEELLEELVGFDCDGL
jgi:hypothetical protein